jgi:hypothetical protein
MHPEQERQGIIHGFMQGLHLARNDNKLNMETEIKLPAWHHWHAQTWVLSGRRCSHFSGRLC